MQQRRLSFLLVVAISLVVAVLTVSDCFAGQFYPGGRQRCLSSSGGRADFMSVIYACDKATVKSQNACTAWLGPVGNSATRTIYLSAASIGSTVTLSLYGMCTDKPDTTSAMAVAGDGGSIGSGNGKLPTFTRSGTWGSPSSITTTINVSKFIQGAAIVDGMYFRRVGIGRGHSDGASFGGEVAFIYLKVGGEIPKPPVEDPAALCRRWAPSGAPGNGASAYYGTTSIDVRVKNMNQRFGNTGFGDWNNGTIYAMPTDEIGWIECYYGGTPGTGHTKVSSINGGQRTYPELSGDWCHSSSSGGVWVPGAGFYPYIGVGATALQVTYYELWSRSPVWQNQFSIWGNGQVVRSGDSIAGGSFNVFTNTTAVRRNGYPTKEGEAGSTFTEYGQTGAPKYVNITASNPSKTINKSYYETTELNYADPKSCWVNVANPGYNPLIPGSTPTIPVYVTNGYYCGYNTMQVPHYDGYSCTNSYNNTLWNASVDYSPHNDHASVQVPYNFENYTGVILESDLAFSGEQVKVDNVWTSVEARSNAVTKATYATQVPDAKLKLFAYVVSDPDAGNIGGKVTSNSNACSIMGNSTKQCMEFDSRSGLTLNASGSLAGAYEEFGGGDFNAFDASAGDFMCFVSAVFPATSGSDTQMGTGGDGNWRYSSPACLFIAKKPTFQVWGDSLYSVGSIKANTGAKRNIYSSYWTNRTNLCKNVCFKPKTSSTATIYFGSWSEQSLIIRDGVTSTVASGAATGLNDGNYAKSGTTGEFCKTRSPLSFANDCNTTNEVGRSKIDSAVGNRQELIDYWIGGGTDVGACTSGISGGTCRKLESANNKNIYYVSGGNLNVSGVVPRDTTYLIKASGTVTFTGDLRYAGGNYSMVGNIPKVVIYAQNFNIQCNVNQIDAILITASGGRTDTCSNASNDVNDRARSRQLKIFGTVMTDSIDLKRTYGAAANENGNRTDPVGTPSDGAAAEVFDYDPTILMWSEFMSGSGESDTLQTTYQHELAPRY